jgi:hypothetical protein
VSPDVLHKMSTIPHVRQVRALSFQ